LVTPDFLRGPQSTALRDDLCRLSRSGEENRSDSCEPVTIGSSTTSTKSSSRSTKRRVRRWAGRSSIRRS